MISSSQPMQRLCTRRQPDVRFFTRLSSTRKLLKSQRPPSQRVLCVRAASSKASTTKNLRLSPERAPRPGAAPPSPSTYVRPPVKTTAVDSRILEQARRLLGDHDELLLYTAPSHKSLFASSVVGGTAFLTVCATAAQSMVLIPNISVLLRFPALIGALLGISISSAMFWTTIRQIQSLRLIRSTQHGIMMQVESKSRLLTGRKQRFNISLDNIRSDRDIKSAVVSYRSIVRADGFKWTEFEDERERMKLGARLTQTWNEFDLMHAISNIWPSIKLDTARMFSRAGMVYVRIENQNWKLDLMHASLLDRGIPLSDVIKEDPEVRDSVIGMLRRQLSST